MISKRWPANEQILTIFDLNRVFFCHGETYKDYVESERSPMFLILMMNFWSLWIGQVIASSTDDPVVCVGVGVTVEVLPVYAPIQGGGTRVQR